MAVVGKRTNDVGEVVERTVLLPSHDPDEQDEGLALELALDRATEAVIAAVRKHLRHYDADCTCDACTWDRASKLPAVLAAYDAAVAANRAHYMLTEQMCGCPVCGCDYPPESGGYNSQLGLYVCEGCTAATARRGGGRRVTSGWRRYVPNGSTWRTGASRPTI